MTYAILDFVYNKTRSDPYSHTSFGWQNIQVAIIINTCQSLNCTLGPSLLSESILDFDSPFQLNHNGFAHAPPPPPSMGLCAAK